MTILTDQLTRAGRRRLLEHLAEADGLDRLMRQPDGLPAVPEPVPLHQAARSGTTFSTKSTTTFSTTERTTMS